MKVDIQEQDGQFVTTCDKIYYLTGKTCGGQLYLINACVQPDMGDVPIMPDGFDIHGSTTGEMVKCDTCGHIGDLEIYED
jgi:hypothetical protein